MSKQCEECPYKVKSSHNDKFVGYVNKMFESKMIESKKHTCHMKGNVWSKPTKENVCVGSLKNK